MRLKALFGLILIVLLSACESQNTDAVKIDTYFDLVGLLDEQAEQLYESGARIEKVLVANGEEEKMLIRPDSVGQLRTEWQLFYEADINKLGLDDAYYVEGLPGLDGGRKEIYTAKKKAANVRLIEYDYQNDRLRYIRILIQEKNDIYNFQKEMLLNFEEVDGKAMITDYSINGKQDMVMKSELSFALSGKVLFNP